MEDFHAVKTSPRQTMKGKTLMHARRNVGDLADIIHWSISQLGFCCNTEVKFFWEVFDGLYLYFKLYKMKFFNLPTFCLFACWKWD